ncbi:MAG: hypothetical protein MJ245_05980 [Clostridia bacterium]|nr:hypothetical protein [Clostridia bacterium]
MLDKDYPRRVNEFHELRDKLNEELSSIMKDIKITAKIANFDVDKEDPDRFKRKIERYDTLKKENKEILDKKRNALIKDAYDNGYKYKRMTDSFEKLSRYYILEYIITSFSPSGATVAHKYCKISQSFANEVKMLLNEPNQSVKKDNAYNLVERISKTNDDFSQAVSYLYYKKKNLSDLEEFTPSTILKANGDENDRIESVFCDYLEFYGDIEMYLPYLGCHLSFYLVDENQFSEILRQSNINCSSVEDSDSFGKIITEGKTFTDFSYKFRKPSAKKADYIYS